MHFEGYRATELVYIKTIPGVAFFPDGAERSTRVSMTQPEGRAIASAYIEPLHKHKQLSVTKIAGD